MDELTVEQISTSLTSVNKNYYFPLSFTFKEVDLNNLSIAALHRFAIAKEMYIQGIGESLKNSSISRILAILNFDYVAETLIKAVLLDKNVKLEKNSGDFKSFYNLRNDLHQYYNKVSVISELMALHKLKNDIQHNASIASEQDITRHKLNVRLFFDEICKDIYRNKITFESISLAYLVDSKNEIIILQEMEKALENKNYPDAIKYSKEAIQYHRELIRMNMEAPNMLNSNGYRYILSGVKGASQFGYGLPSLNSQAEQYFSQLNRTIKWLVNRRIFPEHDEEVQQLLDPFEGQLELNPDKEKAESARLMAYNIITGTQWQLKKFKDVKKPLIFAQSIVQVGTDKILLLGIASTSELSEVKLRFSKNRDNEKIIDGDKKIGIQEIHIDADLTKNYNELRISIRNIEQVQEGCFIRLK